MGYTCTCGTLAPAASAGECRCELLKYRRSGGKDRVRSVPYYRTIVLICQESLRLGREVMRYERRVMRTGENRE
jgi:hypothetical protein